MSVAPTPIADRFWPKVDKNGPRPPSAPHLGPCWLWVASFTPEGYGKIGRGGRGGGTALAHRVSYELALGPIPDGLELDHLCRVRHCVRPAHLEAVTRSVNVRRGAAADGTRRRAATITHCPHGHPYDESNTAWHAGHRSCRSCRRRRKASLRQARSASRSAA